MPIRFRCQYCNRLLGIARRKAGSQTVCPHCGYEITVPDTDDVDNLAETVRDESSPSDVNVLLVGPIAPAVVPAPQPTHQPRTARPAHPESESLPTEEIRVPEERPLFEGDVEALLGGKSTPAPTARPRIAPVSGMEAAHLEDADKPVVLSPQKAAMLVAAFVVLLAGAFIAGFLIASK